MKIDDIASILSADILAGTDKLQTSVTYGFASDLMSDVLTLTTNDVALITGLVNLQALRTAELSDIPVVVFVRGKSIGSDLVNLSNDLGLIVLRTDCSMFRASGLLFEQGLKPIF